MQKLLFLLREVITDAIASARVYDSENLSAYSEMKRLALHALAGMFGAHLWTLIHSPSVFLSALVTASVVYIVSEAKEVGPCDKNAANATAIFAGGLAVLQPFAFIIIPLIATIAVLRVIYRMCVDS